MSLAELLVILMVALIVFGPEKLSLLALKTGKFLNHLKNKKDSFIDSLELIDEKQTLLKLNEKKASVADEAYQQQDKRNLLEKDHPLN